MSPDDIYKSREWAKISRMVRARDGHCTLRTSRNCTGKAEVTDHIVSMLQGGDPWGGGAGGGFGAPDFYPGLRAACVSCNSQRVRRGHGSGLGARIVPSREW